MQKVGKLVLVVLGLFALAVVLVAIVKLVGDGMGAPSGPVLLVTDLVSFAAASAALLFGLKAVEDYGGILGEGLLFVLSGIALVAIYELFDMLLHISSLTQTSFMGVREAAIENVFIALASACILYGLLKIKVVTPSSPPALTRSKAKGP